MESWRTHQFRLERSSDGQPRWWLDVLLFDTLVRDCIESSGPDLALWRIHRRAMDDAAGHEFALICYATGDLHATLDATIAGHSAVHFLRKVGYLRESAVVDSGSGIAATSDASWPDSLQRAWPYYIDGVSRMALELLATLRTSPRPNLDPSAVASCEAYYSGLMGQFTEVWRDWGSHAFLHHINAVFGYEPVVAKPRHVDGSLVVF